MSELEHIQSTTQIGDHNEFVQLCDKALAIWEKRRDNRIEAFIMQRLDKRAAWISKFNKKLFVRFGWRKKIPLDYSVTHYLNAFMNIWRKELVEDHHWYYESPHAFKNEADKPEWWLPNDYYTIYNAYHKASNGIAWINKIREIRKVATDTNVAQLFVSSELYEFIMNWANKDV